MNQSRSKHIGDNRRNTLGVYIPAPMFTRGLVLRLELSCGMSRD